MWRSFCAELIYRFAPPNLFVHALKISLFVRDYVFYIAMGCFAIEEFFVFVSNCRDLSDFLNFHDFVPRWLHLSLVL